MNGKIEKTFFAHFKFNIKENVKIMDIFQVICSRFPNVQNNPMSQPIICSKGTQGNLRKHKLWSLDGWGMSILSSTILFVECTNMQSFNGTKDLQIAK